MLLRVEARAVRVCMASAIVAEVWVYRLVWEGGTPDEKAAARGVILTMMEDVEDVQGMSETMWFQTSMFYALNGLVRQAGPLVKSRILSSVANAATGNIGGLVAELRTTAGQVALVDAMMADVGFVFEAGVVTAKTTAGRLLRCIMTNPNSSAVRVVVAPRSRPRFETTASARLPNLVTRPTFTIPVLGDPILSKQST